MFMKFKIWYFREVLSQIKFKNPNFKINSPVFFGKLNGGEINIESGVNLGYFPSPHFYNSYSHIEVRNGGGL